MKVRNVSKFALLDIRKIQVQVHKVSFFLRVKVQSASSVKQWNAQEVCGWIKVKPSSWWKNSYLKYSQLSHISDHPQYEKKWLLMGGCRLWEKSR